MANHCSQSVKYFHLVSKSKKPQNLRPPLYSAGTPPWSPAGGYKVSEDCQAFEAFEAFKAVEQIRRHFCAVDSELALCQTSKHVS
jgi:hypothetical protein